MTRPDNTRYLRAAAQARHDRALQRAHDAVRSLDRRGQPITFTTVAATAHVSRAWLYRQLDLRTAIITHRQRTSPGNVPAAQRATAESTTARLDALRAEIERLRSASPPTPKHALPAAQRASTDSLRQRLDTLNDEITRLRKENQILRDQLARQLGQRRTTAT